MAITVPPKPGAPAPIPGGEAVTDAELVEAVRNGSDPAFEQLYRRYHRRIAAHVHGMVGDHGRAEDITQEVFMSALRRMRSTDRPILFKPWIYEIAKNACIDQFRRTRRAEEISYDAVDGAGAAARSRLAATGPSPHAQLDQKAAIESLRGALGGLSPIHHEILVLREFEGLSYREIGARLDMSRGSVESTLFRARRRLTDEYAELVSGERCLRVQALVETAGLSAPGVRDQRRLRAHLSHCQPCRRHARRAGLDDALFVAPRGMRAKIAAFFPLPAFLQRRWGADPSGPLLPSGGGAQLAQLSSQYGPNLDSTIGPWSKAVAAAATLAVAGAAGGHAVSDHSREYFGGATPKQAAPPAPATPKQATPPAPTVATPRPQPPPRSATGVPTPSVGGQGRASKPAVGGGTSKPPARAAGKPSKDRAAKGGAGRSAAPGAPAPPAPPASTVAPDKVGGASAPKVPLPATPKVPVTPGAAVGGVQETGRKTVTGAAGAVDGATAAGAGVVKGVTDAGGEATGKATQKLPPVPTVPVPVPQVPVPLPVPGLGG